MSTIILIHGYNANRRFWETILSYLKDHEVFVFEYKGWNGPISGLLGARFSNGRRAKQLSQKVASLVKSRKDQKLVAIAHSNGNVVASKCATKFGCFNHLVCINPALDKAHEFAEHLKRIDVFHDPLDLAVSLSDHLIKHPWGKMGATGYKGTDKRVVNHRIEKPARGASKAVSHHSKLVNRRDLRRKWWPQIAALC